MKPNNKLKMKPSKALLVMTIIMSFAFSGLTILFTSPSGKETGPYELNTSAGEIDIVSPSEGQVISILERGFYPATHGFEDTSDGDEPSGWDEAKERGGDIHVTFEVAGHKKVLALDDQSSSDGRYLALYKKFSEEKDDGIVEFWVRIKSGSTDRYYVAIKDITSSSKAGAWLLFLNGKVYNYDGDNQEVCSFEYDRWYHVKMYFNCYSSYYSWKGWDLWIDGVKKNMLPLSFRDQANVFQMDQFLVHTTSKAKGTMYIDAVGFSWDSNYHIGKNTQEGLNVDIDLFLTFDTLKYWLDGGSPVSISGDFVLPMPADGDHSLKVSGTAGGTIYESDVRNFKVESIAILSPLEGNITKKRKFGYFPATDGFDWNQDYERPSGWTVVRESGGSIQVDPGIERHEKVAVLEDLSTSSGNSVAMHKDFPERQSGTVEFWARIEAGSTGAFDFAVLDGSSAGAWLVFKDGFLYRINYDDSHVEICEFEYDRWYHLRMEFCCFGNQYVRRGWYLWINGDSTTDISGMPFPFRDEINAISMDRFLVQTVASSKGKAYLDAVGFSWDPDYRLGNNLKEGLVLDIDLAFSLDSLSYSLDKTSRVPITGNNVIPMPADGFHELKVFGIRGTTHYQSITRYFSTTTIEDIRRPTISLMNLDNGTNVRELYPLNIKSYDNIGVWLVEVFVDGKFFGSERRSSLTELWEFTYQWDTTSLDEGKTEISIKAYDLKGGVNEIARTVTVDNMAERLAAFFWASNPLADSNVIYEYRDVLRGRGYDRFRLYKNSRKDQDGGPSFSDRMAEFDLEEGSRDSCFFYFAGHGEYCNPDDRMEYSIIKLPQRVSSGEINSSIENLESHHILIFVEACYAGGIKPYFTSDRYCLILSTNRYTYAHLWPITGEGVFSDEFFYWLSEGYILDIAYNMAKAAAEFWAALRPYDNPYGQYPQRNDHTGGYSFFD
ncbi:MAG: hypothetical protein ACFFAS_20645 [Promethearchaeota archaeon]